MDYVYIDGASLNAETEKLREAMGVAKIDFNYQAFFSNYSASRIFYYDAWPSKQAKESDEAYQVRRDEKERFFSDLSRLPLVHVRDGVSRWRRKRQEQKGVDVLLAADVVSHALRGTIDNATLILSDLDFYPVFDVLLQSRVRTTLIFRAGHTSEHLIEAADQSAWLPWRQLSGCCGSELSNRFAATPHNYSGPLTLSEQENLTTTTFRGQKLAVWKNPTGDFTCWFNNARVSSPLKRIAIEYFAHGTVETLEFDDGYAFPTDRSSE